ncbi:MAG TPA: chemotaxis protein CheB, partial [Methylotenera sp.]|nr:chemotaxis protein CheB [Methylotenera sp.]
MANRKIEGADSTMPSIKLAASNPVSKKVGAKKFPIVGIGSSAGGLEALEQLFRHTPADSGLAFVLVSHLSPDHVSLLTEILQRITTMPVVQAEDQMLVCVNCVYTIPPNRDMAIFHGKLQLSIPDEPHVRRLPINQFFRSLAQDQGKNAIGIILSGTGTDGTAGLRDIVGAGGISLVQEPATAKYDGMSASAIKAGYANYILPVEKMTEVIMPGSPLKKQPQAEVLDGSFLKDNFQQNDQPKQNVNQPYLQQKSVHHPIHHAITDSDMAHILMHLRTITGQDFSLYKKSTIGRRIERRMLQHNIENTELYVRYLKENPAEAHILLKELLINVTNFFR